MPTAISAGTTVTGTSVTDTSVTDTTVAAVTVVATLRSAAHTLAGHSASPRLDAELLLCKVLGWSRAGLLSHDQDRLTPASRDAYEDLLERRRRGEPIAYLTGKREFWSLPLTVTPAVLVPRPETELLVEQVLARLSRDAPCAVLDLGTGSGAIALALRHERPNARITAVDISAAALAVARHNAAELKLPGIDWRQGSWFDAVPGERFDLIASNPPYVAANDPALPALSAEPLLALSPGPTGLEALTGIIERAVAYLSSSGWLVLEHGAAQDSAVAQLLEHHGFGSIRCHRDYADKPRVTLATLISSH